MRDGLLAATGSSGSSNLTFLVVMVVAVGLFWLMTSRTRKAQKAQQQQRNNVAPGDDVMTASGQFGTVVDADGDVITLETSPGVHTRWVRAAISRKVEPGAPGSTRPADAVAATGAAALGTRAAQASEEEELDEFAVPDDLSGLDQPRSSIDDPPTDEPKDK